MEAQHQFNLQDAIEKYLLQLNSKGNYTADDLRELKTHLLDETDELSTKGLDEEEVFLLAKKRLGNEELLCREYEKLNGSSFYSRDLFIMAISICTYLFLYFIYSIVAGFIASKGFVSQVPAVWGIGNYVFQLLFLSFSVWLVFNCKRYFQSAEKYFDRSSFNFSTITITILATTYLVSVYATRLFYRPAMSSGVFSNNPSAFIIDPELKNFSDWLLPTVWMIVILLAFTKSYKKLNLLDSIVNNSGYVALVLLGVFWDFVAAFTRSLNNLTGGNDVIKAILFGLIWLAGSLIFNLYLKNNYIKRNIAFIGFGFVMEFVAGIWINPSLRMGTTLSVYFITLLIGYAAGLGLARMFWKKTFTPGI